MSARTWVPPLQPCVGSATAHLHVQTRWAGRCASGCTCTAARARARRERPGARAWTIRGRWIPVRDCQPPARAARACRPRECGRLTPHAQCAGSGASFAHDCRRCLAKGTQCACSPPAASLGWFCLAACPLAPLASTTHTCSPPVGARSGHQRSRASHAELCRTADGLSEDMALWSKAPTAGDAPRARAFHTLTALDASRALLLGGTDADGTPMMGARILAAGRCCVAAAAAPQHSARALTRTLDATRFSWRSVSVAPRAARRRGPARHVRSQRCRAAAVRRQHRRREQRARVWGEACAGKRGGRRVLADAVLPGRWSVTLSPLRAQLELTAPRSQAQ